MKTLTTFCFFILTSILFAQSSTVPSMVIGGIEVRGVPANEDVLRSVIYKNLVNSKRYVVNDRYDVGEKLGADKLKSCLGKECLVRIGTELNADFALSASYEGLGDRILISMKIVDVKAGTIVQNEIEQFENQPKEINRMTDVMIYRLLKSDVDLSVYKPIMYKDGPAATTGLGRMNNNGPRIGFALVTGQNADVLTRSENDGGLGGYPMLFNIGYQLEKQYAGSENFSGLFEFIGNVGGLDQGVAIPSLAVLHGIRFGKGAWEIAIGPSFSVKKLRTVTQYNGQWVTESQLYGYGFQDISSFEFTKRPDMRGASYFNSNFVVGFGKTFRPGALNVPINAYASFNKYGIGYGVSVGINITKSRSYTTTRL